MIRRIKKTLLSALDDLPPESPSHHRWPPVVDMLALILKHRVKVEEDALTVADDLATKIRPYLSGEKAYDNLLPLAQTIMQRLILGLWNGARQGLVCLMGDSIEDLPQEGGTPLDEVVERSDRLRWERALESLTRSDRELINWRRRGLSY